MNKVHPIFQPIVDAIAPPREVPSEDATLPRDMCRWCGQVMCNPDVFDEHGDGICVESSTVGGWPRSHIGKREDDDE